MYWIFFSKEQLLDRRPGELAALANNTCVVSFQCCKSCYYLSGSNKWERGWRVVTRMYLNQSTKPLWPLCISCVQKFWYMFLKNCTNKQMKKQTPRANQRHFMNAIIHNSKSNQLCMDGLTNEWTDEWTNMHTENSNIDVLPKNYKWINKNTT